jgi:hypothetical protein
MYSLCGFFEKKIEKGTVLTILVWLVAPARQDQFFQQVGGVGGCGWEGVGRGGGGWEGVGRGGGEGVGVGDLY